MNITSHQAVISALTARGDRFKNKGKLPNLDERLLSSALDERGTVDVNQCVEEGVNVIEVNDRERLALLKQQEINNLRDCNITEEVQRIH